MNAPGDHSDEEPQHPSEAPEGMQGWDTISEWTDGIQPEDIDTLRSVRELEQVYPLLHALGGRSPRDFLVRAAVIEALVSDGRGSFTAEDLAEVVYWLEEGSRQTVLRVLRRSGWLVFDPEEGTRITPMGRWAYDVLSFLHRRLREGEILPTLAGVEYALEIGLDPIRHLQSMRSRLVRLRDDMDAARRSHSEVILRDAAKNLDSALDLSKQIRMVLERIPTENRQARQIVRDVHDLLSRLHVVASDLHSAVTQVGRQYLELTGGLTVEQIVRALMRRSRDELADLAREALLPVHRVRPLLTVDVIAAAAELYLLRERTEAEPVSWEEPPEPVLREEAAEIPEEITSLLSDLARIAGQADPVPLDAFVPRTDSGTSFLRASLVALAGEVAAGEGVTGRIGSMPLDLETSGDGWPQKLQGGPLTRLTPGVLAPRKKEGS